jgi:hypothetical protein
VRRSVLLVSALAAMLAGTAACTSSTNGSPVPGGSGTSAPAPPSSGETTDTGSSTPSPGDNPLANTDPCTLLTTSAQSQLGVSGGERRDLGTERGCRWRLRGPSETFIFDVAIDDQNGLKDVPSDATVKPLADIGKHKAVQSPAKQGGGCSVLLGVGDSSRVDATAVAGVDVNKGCELATQLAQLVEPQLP